MRYMTTLSLHSGHTKQPMDKLQVYQYIEDGNINYVIMDSSKFKTGHLCDTFKDGEKRNCKQCYCENGSHVHGTFYNYFSTKHHGIWKTVILQSDSPNIKPNVKKVDQKLNDDILNEFDDVYIAGTQKNPPTITKHYKFTDIRGYETPFISKVEIL